MLVSYKQLQDLIKDPLPAVTDLVEGITFHAFEVDGVEEVKDDLVIDVKILPDRAHDCLSHYGIAKEISAIFNLSLKEKPVPEVESSNSETLDLIIADQELCGRYLGSTIKNVVVIDSPEWLKDGLEVIGQRSINNVVDATNYLLFKYGQPLHAFDADLVKGNIVLRQAEAGETITTLDGREIVLDPSIFIEADDLGPLAIAGIKGGNRAGITTATKNLIVVAGNFKPNLIRVSSQKLGIRTDASKRFENGITPELAERGIKELISLLLALNPEAQVVNLIDVYPVSAPQPITISITVAEIVSKLGVQISPEEISAILNRLDLKPNLSGNTIICSIPVERLDLRIPEDLIDEVARLYGYDKIPTLDLPPYESKIMDPIFQPTIFVQSVLLPLGFSEIYGYTFQSAGELEIANPLTKDGAFVRSNLTTGLINKLTLNLKNILFDDEGIFLFEIGTVFTNGKEEVRVAIGTGYSKKKFNQGEQKIKMALANLGVENIPISVTDTTAIAEFPLSLINIEKEGVLTSYLHKNTRYQKYSPFPRITRDVALFVPWGTDPDEPAKIIETNAGELLVRGPILFDQFAKEKELSLAFRLVFQAPDRTLTDEEVGPIMNKVTIALESANFEVRK